MAVSSILEVNLHKGSRGFRADFEADEERDRSLYQTGVALESQRFVSGSVAQRVFARLSGTSNAGNVIEAANPADVTVI